MAKEVDPNLEMIRLHLAELEQYVVRVRYPGTIVEKEDAKAAFKSAKVMRETMRQKLGLG